MGLVVLLAVGGILGWLASIVVRSEATMWIVLNIVAGIIGAVLAGLLINPLLGGSNMMAGDLSASSLIASFLGAVVLLALVNVVRTGAVR